MVVQRKQEQLLQYELTEDPEPYLKNGSKKINRSGPFNGIRNSGSPSLKNNSMFTYSFVVNETDVYYTFQLVNQSTPLRYTVKQNGYQGELVRFTWVDQKKSWAHSIPRDPCDGYGLSGANSICSTNELPVCRCLKGFKPRSPQDYNQLAWSQGCEPEKPFACNEGNKFMKLNEMKLPDAARTWMNKSMGLEECRVNCLKNCSCMAYANWDIRGNGSGCVIWFGDLLDVRKMLGAEQDLYIRMLSSEFDADVPKEPRKGTEMPKETMIAQKRKKPIKMIITISVIFSFFLLGAVSSLILKKKIMQGIQMASSEDRGQKGKTQDAPFGEGFMHGKRDYPGENDDLELNFFDMDTIVRATCNFSNGSMLGKGGFGWVYKATLEDGQEIAVKRLSKNSGQGDEEFKNEVMLIARLQHRNLVRLLGFCIEGEEKMLVYEYMENKDLDAILFDRAHGFILDWRKWLNIIVGISRGLLYLHQDSRFRIVHRDLKASNVLLDGEMNSKISDFGMARIFGGDDMKAKTKRVMGTYGYMSPEYAMDGVYSVKSDVFSFGVLVLEIISGKKNKAFFSSDKQLNLLGYVWKLWKDGCILKLVDETVEHTYLPDEALRCIQVGLLCIQELAEDRPTMSSVVFMLSTDITNLPQPKQPGFCFVTSRTETETSSTKKELCSINQVTITMPEAR